MSESYRVERVHPDSLSPSDLETCVEIVSDGGAVEKKYPRGELSMATVMVVARMNSELGRIVGVGAIKRERIPYAQRRSALSGYWFDPRTLELGYVAVSAKHRRKGLSGLLVTALLSHHEGPLWATTDHEDMKEKLFKAGFAVRGQEWEGNRGLLSLWWKD